MKLMAGLIAAVVAIAAPVSCRGDEPARRSITQSIPADVILCVRLDLTAIRKAEQAQSILDATVRKFKEQIDAVGALSSLDIQDIDCIWIGVVKDKEALVVLEAHLDTEAILNSPVVSSSRRLARPGTITAIEMKDEKTGEPSHAVVINDSVVAFGPPQLVDTFVMNYIRGVSGLDKSELAVVDSVAASDAMLLVALMRVPEKEIEQKPFLGAVVDAQVELNVHEKVAATARIDMQDEGKATALKDLISGFIGLGLTSEIKVDYPDIKKAILDGLKLEHAGKTVTLSATMDLELLRKLLATKGLELR